MTQNEMRWAKPLDELEMRFVYEYLLDPTNGTQAFMRAFHAVRGRACSIKFAWRKAHELLRKDPRIAKELEQKRKVIDEELTLDATRVLREIMLLAFSDIRDAYTVENGNDKLRKIRKLPPAIAKCVQSIKYNKDSTLAELKLYDKGAALKKLCDHLGLSKQGGALEDLLEILKASAAKKDESEAIDNGPGPGRKTDAQK